MKRTYYIKDPPKKAHPMTPPRFLRISLALVFLLSAPAAASACVINVSHFFVPWPPCLADAGKLAVRLDGRNAQILGDVMLTIKMVNSVKQEVNTWKEATSEISNIQSRLRRVYGSVSVSPIASLAVAYQRTALASYVSVGTKGQLGLGGSITDILGESRARVRSFSSGSIASAALGGTAAKLRAAGGSMAARQTALVENSLSAMTDYRQRVDLLTDSVFAAANRRATRYGGEQSPEGYAEGILSMSEASLTQARVSALAAQTKSIPGRQVTFEHIGLAEDAINKSQAKLKHGIGP